ncbi:MAG: hypothetical protein IK136_04840 [Oscillospiraceae bacterium]|nr:hypothetical protein [Oscillospiraceae bacterium]
MKRFTAALLVVLLLFSMAACSGDNKVDKKMDQEFRDSVETILQLESRGYYAIITGVVDNFFEVDKVAVNIATVSHGGDYYTAKGRVNIVANNGKKYNEEFTVVCMWNGENFIRDSVKIADQIMPFYAG